MLGLAATLPVNAGDPTRPYGWQPELATGMSERAQDRGSHWIKLSSSDIIVTPLLTVSVISCLMKFGDFPYHGYRKSARYVCKMVDKRLSEDVQPRIGEAPY